MTERQKLTLNRPRKASQEGQTSNTSVYGKKVWVNAAPKKQAKKPKPQKVVKQQPKKLVEKPKQEVKVKTPKPPTPPKKRLPLDEAISQISTFWPYLFPEGKLCPMKIGIQQDMWQEVKENDFPIARRRLRACLGSIGHHADYRALIQLGANRYDKSGQISGIVTQADVEDNLQRLARRNKNK
ncbi:ProQ/FINO family protein (plasmid) [Arsenophonus nasoniae]|uniref:Fertility inhibition protein n=1 Tax=Arsenophonus nasoniae TaxID=638 RepID=A0A4P7L1X0_9GAMM|nr:ProQ/FINO family protein [Arsenophonus nasoniae]QBY46436.1 Fertility inhibition protein [Arsenophonus nasoniae]QBY46524.1 Fertility inhibition protein [Arsenophonus nasoniae]WGM08581.1 ProQ/FINO family protein [Arsenophonus nasoniae]WGM13375.1 ProQ/FINO family protein [Arsenophonus nasoniae]WGM17948.1 ProQ/FINO family protein [Arsenophonus nasoniae]